MTKNRLEAFSDGVLAIIITIMVLELRVPHGATLAALSPLKHVFFSYVLSYVYLGIYWNNHHHLIHATQRVNGPILWANLHLLFWLSLIPFVTGWMGENHFASLPSALYGGVLLAAALAYWVLVRTIIHTEGPDCPVAKAVGKDEKGNVSLALYVVAIAAGFWHEWMAWSLYAAVALLWLIPDPRIERVLKK